MAAKSINPGVIGATQHQIHIFPSTTPTPVRWCRSRAAASPPTGTHPCNSSILEMAEACDVPVRWSCRTGVCHSCESGLVSGAVTYGPEPLDKPADGNILNPPLATEAAIR